MNSFPNAPSKQLCLLPYKFVHERCHTVVIPGEKLRCVCRTTDIFLSSLFLDSEPVKLSPFPEILPPKHWRRFLIALLAGGAEILFPSGSSRGKAPFLSEFPPEQQTGKNMFFKQGLHFLLFREKWTKNLGFCRNAFGSLFCFFLRSFLLVGVSSMFDFCQTATLKSSERKWWKKYPSSSNV